MDTAPLLVAGRAPRRRRWLVLVTSAALVGSAGVSLARHWTTTRQQRASEATALYAMPATLALRDYDAALGADGAGAALESALRSMRARATDDGACQDCTASAAKAAAEAAAAATSAAVSAVVKATSKEADLDDGDAYAAASTLESQLLIAAQTAAQAETAAVVAAMFLLESPDNATAARHAAAQDSAAAVLLERVAELELACNESAAADRATAAAGALTDVAHTLVP